MINGWTELGVGNLGEGKMCQMAAFKKPIGNSDPIPNTKAWNYFLHLRVKYYSYD